MIKVQVNISDEIKVTSSFSSVSVGPACADATYDIKDSGDNTLYSGSIASGDNLDQTIQDSTVNVKKSDGVLINAVGVMATDTEDYNVADSSITVNGAAFASVKATDSLDVPVEYENGTPIGTIVGGVVEVPDPITPSGIAYQRPMLTGQVTSYRTGDDGWHYANGTYDYTPPTNPTHIAELSDFLTLKNNNVFGNTNRFTDENGLQVYGNDYVIDHYTGLGWKITTDTNFIAWNGAIDSANAYTNLGYSDWRVPNRNELFSIAKNDNPPAGVDPLDYSPFNYNPNYYITSSTTWYSSTYAVYLYLGCTMTQQTKVTTSNTVTFICRNHFN